MDIFTALSDPNRRQIIELLAMNGQLSATQISDKFKISAPAISQHLKILKEAELVEVEKKAQLRIYTLNKKKLMEFEEWIKKVKEFWDVRFEALDKLLEKEKSKLKGGVK